MASEFSPTTSPSPRGYFFIESATERMDTFQVLQATGFCMTRLAVLLPATIYIVKSFLLQKALEKAAYARRNGARSFVKSETDLTAMQWESCCVPAYLLFPCFILLYCSPDVWGMQFLSSLICVRKGGDASLLYFRRFSLQSVVLVGSSLKQKSLDSCIQEYSFAFVEIS